MKAVVVFRITVNTDHIDDELPCRALARLVSGQIDLIEGAAFEDGKDSDEYAEGITFAMAPRNSLGAMPAVGSA